ncbi:MAG TPA: 5'/3'-nucleotidase SurE [Saprospiraceae bacterium]|jgi:5'-nucleotidase|nr:5'/3'-nucleotidase SurE [Saprospiraceae bacterium]MCC6687572.1 5'/3'-nucleotidase SurE [Saprospiraceae bacterium]HMX82553.1 5'/3'-nucleotidase SurE [Saprospiraceae bacterium]HMX85853.1 5'/3'-nucleotidase SurE [Saprospiraceae bacterium]HMZ73706.1 5'/3'-nucleotidase SurE [Saprospiraceae bacterium]
MNKPLILVTNDDGITAPGIRKLMEIAKQLGEIVVVAPDSPQSGQGHAITIEQPLRLKKVHIFDDVSSWECSGTPVDCVKLAKNVLLKDRKIDLCVSGINHGSNSSLNIIYSGTMSAAMEAAVENIPSVGFSLLDYSFDADFDQAEPYIRQIMEYVLQNRFEPYTLLNVNIPKLSKDEIQGVRVCRQAKARWIEDYMEAKDPRGQSYYWLTGKFVNEDEGVDTDVFALENGYISVVPAQYDLTFYEQINNFKQLETINP